MEDGVNISSKEIRKCRRALVDVFKSINFTSPALRQNLYESYMCNIRELIEYAHVNKIDSVKHVRSIRRLLVEYGAGYKLKVRHR